MVIDLEMTFLRCFLYNTLILLTSAAIAKYRRIARLILMSAVISFANIFMLYINSSYVFHIARSIIFCVFPAAALGKTSLNKIITVLSAGILFCGSAVVTSQITENIYIHFTVSSLIALAACGMLPVIRKRTFIKHMTVKISREGMRPISAFVDTGIACREGLVVVLEKSFAKSLLTDEELNAALRPENNVTVKTVGAENTGLSFIDINDLCVCITNKTKILPARIMLTDSMLPCDALISAANELEASA